MSHQISPIGLGSKNANIHFYIANRPPIDDYPFLTKLRSLVPGEISHIGKNTSNHWRKVFNVYAKFLFDWYIRQQNERGNEQQNFPSCWQDYRDTILFQATSREALLFSKPLFNDQKTIHIIAGKTYASSLNLPPLIWLDNYFAINKGHRLIVSPYPDYRQLSNERIEKLIEISKSLT